MHGCCLDGLEVEGRDEEMLPRLPDGADIYHDIVFSRLCGVRTAYRYGRWWIVGRCVCVPNVSYLRYVHHALASAPEKTNKGARSSEMLNHYSVLYMHTIKNPHRLSPFEER